VGTRPDPAARRFVPGGRTATTLASGTLGMPWRRFVAVDAAACAMWAAYVTALGYLGGNTFQHSLWKPLLAAGIVGVIVTVLADVYRRLRLRAGDDTGANRAEARQAGY
jgi:membrane-associated protein